MALTDYFDNELSRNEVRFSIGQDYSYDRHSDLPHSWLIYVKVVEDDWRWIQKVVFNYPRAAELPKDVSTVIDSANRYAARTHASKVVFTVKIQLTFVDGRYRRYFHRITPSKGNYARGKFTLSFNNSHSRMRMDEVPKEPLRLPIPELTFGAEFELFLNSKHLQGIQERKDIAISLAAMGLRCRNAKYMDKATDGFWKIKKDTSIVCPCESPNCLTFELVSPILKGGKGLGEVSRTLSLVRRLAPRTTVTAAFHVHVGFPVRYVSGIRKLVKQFILYEAVFDSIVPRSRRANAYAKSFLQFPPTRQKKIEIFKKLNKCLTLKELIELLQPADRYVKLNLRCLPTQGTVEFRQHSSTSNYQKAAAWIRLLLRFVQESIGRESPKVFAHERTLEEKFHYFFRQIIKDRWLYDFYLARRKELEKESPTFYSTCNDDDFDLRTGLVDKGNEYREAEEDTSSSDSFVYLSF